MTADDIKENFALIVMIGFLLIMTVAGVQSFYRYWKQKRKWQRSQRGGWRS